MAAILTKAATRPQTDADWDNRPRGGIILINSTGGVLILKDAANGKWSFPKGAIEEADEGNLLSTAKRECREEVGLEEGRDYTLFPGAAMNHFKNIFYVASLMTGAEARLKVDPLEVSEIAWLVPERCTIPFAELNAAIRFFLKRWV